MTRPNDHLLQLRAEKENGLDRMHSIQSAGHATSCERLLAVSPLIILFHKNHLPIFSPTMGQVRKYDLLGLFRR